MLNVVFAGDSVAWEHPQRQWGSVLSSPKTQPLWPQGGGGGEACGLSSIPRWGVADTGYTMAQLVPAALGHLRTLRKRAASKFSLMTHAYNPSTWEEENRESGVQGQPGLRETVTKK